MAVAAVNAGAQDGEITYDEYQERIGSGQERLDYSERLIGHDKIHTLVPETKRKESQDDERAAKEDSLAEQGDREPKRKAPNESSSKASGDSGDADPPAATSQDKGGGREKEKTPTPDDKRDPQTRNSRGAGTSTGNYIAPSLRNGGAAGKRNQASVSRPDGPEVTFGISIGKTIPVRLSSSASNIQPGLISVEVTEAIQGREKVLPAGTRLFAHSSSVIGSDRLFLRISKGVTPSGEEFPVRGAIFDDNREPGLAGRVVSDGRSLERATSAGVNTLGKELLDAAPLKGAGGEAADATLGQLLDEKRRKDSAETGRPAYVVVAKPQAAIVQVERTF